MTRKQVVLKAIEGQITWIQAAAILGISDRQMRRLKTRYEQHGYGGLRDYRSGKPRRKRIPVATIERMLKLKRETYADFSMRHFHEQLRERHGVRISYTWMRLVLQEAGLVRKAPARGKYRRLRERRPMTGMLLHMDASTHCWISGLAMRDLNIVLDDATGEILYGEFVEQEGLLSTFAALRHVLSKHGRFCELYTDRGSHFCSTPVKGFGPSEEQNGNTPRVLKALGIRQILARSPQARGRSERCFGTIQGRLPQELRLNKIRNYDQANRYLQTVFIPDFNRRFAVKAAVKETAFVPLVGIDLELLLSVQTLRHVRNDHPVTLNGQVLQLPEPKGRPSLAGCQVLVHQFVDRGLAISFQSVVLARFNPDGDLVQHPKTRRRAA
jgi:transposase